MRRATALSGIVAVALCLAALVASSSIPSRDNTMLALTLGRLRAPDDPVLFVGEYLPDIPLHARLMTPVPVTGNWSDPNIERRDNWRRELAEAAPFAPALAARLLVDTQDGLALRCGNRPLWAIAKTDVEGPVAALPGAVRIASANRVALWRVAAADCVATPGGAMRP